MSDSPEERITVTPEELERAITVWLMVMPAYLWRPYEKMLAIDRTRRKEEDRVDPRHILSAYLAGKFGQAKWQASYPKPPEPRSPPPWRPPARDEG